MIRTNSSDNNIPVGAAELLQTVSLHGWISSRLRPQNRQQLQRGNAFRKSYGFTCCSCGISWSAMSLPPCNIFREVQVVHETGYFSATTSLDDRYQEVGVNTRRRIAQLQVRAALAFLVATAAGATEKIHFTCVVREQVLVRELICHRPWGFCRGASFNKFK